MAIGLLCLLTAGCSRKIYVPVESVRYVSDTLRTVQLRVDSVYLHDSVAVVQRGDTIFATRWHTRYRDRYHTDTVYSTVTDTSRIKVPYPVEKKLTKWEQTKMDFGGVAIGGVALAVCIAVLWLIKKFRR